MHKIVLRRCYCADRTLRTRNPRLQPFQTPPNPEPLKHYRLSISICISTQQCTKDPRLSGASPLGGAGHMGPSASSCCESCPPGRGPSPRSGSGIGEPIVPRASAAWRAGASSSFRDSGWAPGLCTWAGLAPPSPPAFQRQRKHIGKAFPWSRTDAVRRKRATGSQTLLASWRRGAVLQKLWRKPRAELLALRRDAWKCWQDGYRVFSWPEDHPLPRHVRRPKITLASLPAPPGRVRRIQDGRTGPPDQRRLAGRGGPVPAQAG